MKKILSAISVVLCAAIILSFGAIVPQAAGPLKFLVIGDSIGVGMFAVDTFPSNFDPYTDLPWDATYYTDSYSKVVARDMGFEWTNYAHAEDKTADLLSKVKTDAAIRSAIAAADIIEISIGGNDLIGANNQIALATDLLIGSFNTIDPILATAKTNFGSIINEIKALNPSAIRIVQNIYDMGPGAANREIQKQIPLPLSISNANWTAVVERGNQRIFQNYLNENPGAYLIADVYSAALFRGTYTAPDDVHPNKAGHAIIATVIKNLLKSNGVYPSVTVTSGGNGTASASHERANTGTQVTLTAVPAAGYRFKEWQVVKGGVTVTNNKFTMPSTAVEVKAIFELIPYDITVTSGGNGTASASAASASAGTAITLTPSPAAGYRFKEWQVVSGGVTITNNKFTMPANAVEVKAIFELIPYDITVTNNGNGAAFASAAAATAGTAITLTATPDSGYRFEGWQVLSGGVTITDNAFTMPGGPVAVQAIFELITYPVTVTGDGNGTGSANPANAAPGVEVTLTAAPAPAYRLKEWQVLSGGVTIADDKFTMPANAVEVQALFELIPTYAITVANDGNGTASASADYAAAGTEITLTVTPKSGYQHKGWVVFGGSGITVVNNTFIMPANDVLVKATFEPIPVDTYAVTVNSGGNGTAKPSAAYAAAGTVVTLTATPNSGYRFKEWQVVSGGVTIADNKFTMPAQAVEVKAVFEPIPTYAVTVINDGNGTAGANPANAKAGTEITLTATPNSGYRFKEWQVLSGGVTVANNKFTMPAQIVELKALFELIPSYAVTVAKSGYGTAKTSAQYAVAGAEVTLTATPDSGYQFKEWQVVSGGITLPAGNTVTFTMPAATVEVKAIFEPIPPSAYAVTVTSGGNGTASANPTNATAGTVITLTPTPDLGYQLREWQVVSGGVTVADNKFTMPENAVEVKAIFELIPPSAYAVTVSSGGNGTASANPVSATAGTVITLTATPASGYQFKEWQVVSGGVTVADNKFTMPANAVEVKAIFEVIPAVPADKAALNQRLGEIGNTANNNYTADTWNAFQSALQTARTVAGNLGATQAQVDNALGALNSAYSALTQKAVVQKDSDYIWLWGKKTGYLSNFLNWMLCIFCFGWIWMAF